MMFQRIQYGAVMVGMLVAAPVWAQTAVATAPAAVQAPRMPLVDGMEIDRVVAIVNGDLVLESDVDEEMRFQKIQPYRDTPDSARNTLVERLINRDLILQQAKLQPEDPIADADVDKEIAGLRKNIVACKEFDCASDAGWTKYLAVYGFTPVMLRERWAQRMEVLRFIEERFRQGIKITDVDIKKYYVTTMLPEYAKQNVAAPKLETVSDRIQEVLLEQQVSALLGDWLKSLRAQGSVVVLHPGEGAP